MERKTMQTKANTRYERCSCADGKAVLNRHPSFGTVLWCALLSAAGRIALFLLVAMAVALGATGLGFAQLADSPWPMRGHDAKHTSQSPYKGPPTANLKWNFATGGAVRSSPAIGSDRTVYVGSYDNYLYAINSDGNLKWKFETGNYVYSSPAIGSDGTVYVGSYDNHLYAINPDGNLKWKFETGDDVTSSPALGSDGTVYVGSDDNGVYALGRASGPTIALLKKGINFGLIAVGSSKQMTLTVLNGGDAPLSVSSISSSSSEFMVSPTSFTIPVDSSGSADLGTESDPGKNEIYRHRGYNLINSTNSEVSAIGNWWGSDPPMEELFDGEIVYEPWLVKPWPWIEKVSPNSGSTEGEILITITGDNFAAGATVTVGGKDATDINIDSETQITAIVPAGMAGWASIVVTNPDGKQASLSGGFEYIPQHIYYQTELSLTKGPNIISLPLRPDNAYTASTLASEVSATVILRANEGEFQVYIPECECGTDFPIEMGKGYVVNLLKETQFSLTGRTWGTEVPAAPSTPIAETWAFVVAGSLLGEIPKGTNLLVVNHRTGQSNIANINSSGKFTAAFVDMTKRGVVAVGDEISLQILDYRSNSIGQPKRHRITPKQLAGAYLLSTLKTVPTQTRLLQNYPNPFNPDTWLPYQLASDSPVTISIYNIKGQLIRMLHLGNRKVGVYMTKDRAAYWDGKDATGQAVSSGIYFYQLKAGDFSAKRKMAIIK